MEINPTDLTPKAAPIRVGIVQSRFNGPICDTLSQACMAELSVLGVAAENIVRYTVPGALEIPIVLHQLANTHQFDVLIALGAVIRGETYHFELVANESSAGVMQVALDCAMPIINGILTTYTSAQAQARKASKGREAAQAAVEMAYLMRDILNPIASAKIKK